MSHKDAIHKEEYKGLNIYIFPDDDPQSCDPMDWDMLGKQVYWHRRYNLGHCFKETNKCSPEEWLRSRVSDYSEIEKSKEFKDWLKENPEYGIYEYVDEMDLETLMAWFEKHNVVLPVSAYEHGGITISVGYRSGWDSGQLGFVYATHENIKKAYNVKRLTKKVLERAEKTLRSEVETYDSYLTGQVYGYIIEDENGEHLDSCWGFLGDYKYCLEEAKSVADWHVKQKEAEIKLYDERMMQ